MKILVNIDDDSRTTIPEIIDLDTSHDDSTTNRRRRSSSTSSQDNESLPRPITSSNKRKKSKPDDINENNDDKEDLSRTVIQNEAEVCPICLEEWTNSGQHRLVATECGHLFGRMLVTKFSFFFFNFQISYLVVLKNGFAPPQNVLNVNQQ
jgi:hypothetical protein